MKNFIFPIALLICSFFLSCKDYSADFVIDNRTNQSLKILLTRKMQATDTNEISPRTQLYIYSESGSGSIENYLQDLNSLFMFDNIEIFNPANKKCKKDVMNIELWHPFYDKEYAKITLDIIEEDFE